MFERTFLSRLFGRLFCFTAILLIATGGSSMANAGKTTISDTIYRANGTPAAGSLVISWRSFTTYDNRAIAAGQLTQPIGSGGKVTVDLYPTESAQSGVYYKVVLKLADGTSSTEYWSVPIASPATIAAIRSKVAPGIVAFQTISQSDLQSRALDSKVVHNVGSEQIDGSKIFLVSQAVPAPTSADSATSKSYVDSKIPSTGDILSVADAQPVRLAGTRYADKFANIQAAVADAGTTGSVVIPPSYAGTDTWTNANGRSILNFRRGAKSIAGYVSASVFCRFDNVTDNTSCLQAAINYYRDSGSPQKPKAGKVLIDGGVAVISGTINIDSIALECSGWGSSTDSAPNGVIRWATGAPSGIPMFRMGGQGPRLENCRIAGNSANPPSAYVEVAQTSSTGTQTNYVGIRGNWLGYFGYDTAGGSGGQAVIGILFSGAVNTDTNLIEKNTVSSVTDACLKFTNNQASDDHIDTFGCYGAPYGIWTAADIIGTNHFFSGITTAAYYLENQGSISVRGVSGEGNAALLHQKSGSRAFIDMDGWQIENVFSSVPNGYVVDAALAGDNCAGYTETVIRNFDFRNISSPALPYKIHWGNIGNNCRQGGELILDFVGGISENNLDLAGVGSHAWDLRKVYLRKKPDGNGDPGTVAQNILHAGENFDQYRNDILGKLNVWGGTLRTRLDTVQLASCTATGGTGTTYSYKVYGKTGPFNSALTKCTVSGPATLDATHFNTISVAPTARGYDSYCLGGRSSGSELQMVCVRAGAMSSLDIASANSRWKFNDNGTITPSGALPTTATAGRIESEGGVFSDIFGGLTGNVTASNDWTFKGNIDNSAYGDISTQQLTGSRVQAAKVRTGARSNSDLAGQITLSGGSGTYTFLDAYTNAPICVATDTTAANPLKVSATTTSLTITGTGADAVNYVCIGRN